MNNNYLVINKLNDIQVLLLDINENNRYILSQFSLKIIYKHLKYSNKYLTEYSIIFDRKLLSLIIIIMKLEYRIKLYNIIYYNMFIYYLQLF